MIEPEPVDAAAPRYAPGRSLPRARYLPGHSPRPPERGEDKLGDVDWARAGDCERFRLGVDLYNAAFFWEAHEAWEPLWLLCPRGHPLYDGLQGLIQLAAALLKEHLRTPDGARRLARSALEHLERARVGDAALPIDLPDLMARTRRHFAPLEDPAAPPAARPGIRLRP